MPSVSVCFSVDIKSISHVYFSSSHLPGRAVLAVYVFKCYIDPDLEQAGGDPGSGLVSVYAVSYQMLKWKEIKA